MERNMINSSLSARFARRAKMLIRDWSFPVALGVAWSIATAYTLVIVGRQPPPVQIDTTVPQARHAMPVMHAPASLQQPRRSS